MAALTATTTLLSGTTALGSSSRTRTSTPLFRSFFLGEGEGTAARGVAVRLSLGPNPRGVERGRPDGDDDRSLMDPEDMIYLSKLVAGSISGAFIIKYGSLFFPEVTEPNLLKALLMIMSPVAIGIVLLFRRSNFNSQS